MGVVDEVRRRIQDLKGCVGSEPAAHRLGEARRCDYETVGLKVLSVEQGTIKPAQVSRIPIIPDGYMLDLVVGDGIQDPRSFLGYLVP